MSMRAKCPVCGKELCIHINNVKNYAFSLRNTKGKIVSMCCWSCYKKYKVDMILKKDIISEEEANWLKYVRVPIPEHIKVKPPWFMRYKYY